MNARSSRILIAGGCVVLFAACLILYTRCNTFPTAYHPDEQFKGQAIVEGKFKFTQPLLLTSTAGAAAWITGTNDTVQEAVVVGRWTSAAFAAAAVVLFALAAGWQHGAWAGIAVGLALALSHRLLLWSHYMKEDTALALGLAAFVLAATAYWHRPSRKTMLLLGGACGLAIAGKYIGIICIPFAWYVAKSAERQDAPVSRFERKRRARSFLLGCIGVLILFQLPAFIHPIDFFEDLWYELRHPVSGHRGLTYSILWASPFWKMYLNEVPLTVALVAGGYLIFALARWRKLRTPTRLTILIPVAYWVLLICSTIAEQRHLLPMVIFTYYLAAMAVASLIELLPARIYVRGPVLAGAAALLLLLFIHYVPAYFREFRDDTRAVMRRWIAANIPAGAAILAETYVGLPDDETIALGAFNESDRLPQKVQVERFAPKVGTLEEIRAAGFRYIAVAEPSYSRYFNTYIHPRKKDREEFDQRRQWYQRLFAEGELIYEGKAGIEMHSQTSPVVRIYRIR